MNLWLLGLVRIRFTAPLRPAQRAGRSLGRNASLASLRSAPCPLGIADVPLTERAPPAASTSRQTCWVGGKGYAELDVQKFRRVR